MAAHVDNWMRKRTREREREREERERAREGDTAVRRKGTDALNPVLQIFVHTGNIYAAGGRSFPVRRRYLQFNLADGLRRTGGPAAGTSNARCPRHASRSDSVRLVRPPGREFDHKRRFAARRATGLTALPASNRQQVSEWTLRLSAQSVEHKCSIIERTPREAAVQNTLTILRR